MKDSLSGKRVLVTGADGFIGSHLVETLVGLGATVRAATFYNSWNSVGWLADANAGVREALEIFPLDIRDPERVREAVHGVEFVLHLSSLIAIPYSYVAPRSYLETNVVGAINVLEACRYSSSLIRMVHVSTSETYGTAKTVPIHETHPLVGQSPYAASKIAADKFVESYHLSFGVPVVTARPFNTFGPRQTARAVIPTVASQLLSGMNPLKLGSLSPTRDFNYVLDTVAGIVALAGCPDADGQVVNIGTGKEWSIGETVDLLCEILDKDVEIEEDRARVRPQHSEVNRLIADNSLLRRLTNWEPKFDFRAGLELTADWIAANLEYFEPESYAR